MNKSDVLLGTAWFLYSAAFGAWVAHHLIQSPKKFPWRIVRTQDQMEPMLVIPAHGPSYIYGANSWSSTDGHILHYHN
jgi:hypothetical protein